MEKAQKIKINNITEGKLLPALLKFSLPLIMALLLQALYGAVDLIIVGQLGTKASVSAVAMGGQFMHMVTVIIAGICMGGTVIIGNAYGARDKRSVAKSIGNLIFISFVMTIIISLLNVFLAKQFSLLLNIPPEALEGCTQYIGVCGIGVIFIVGYNLLSAVFRGIGNSKVPFICIAISTIANVLLDLLFVGYLRMDAIGAAIATVLAQGLSVLLSILYLIIKKFEIKIEKSDLKPNILYINKILKVGAPIALQDFLTSISFLIISSFINLLGTVQSASVGIGEKLFMFVIIVPMSFMSSISTFVAQNMGAGKLDRAYKSLGYGLIISVIFGIGTFFLTHFGGEALSSLFTKDAEVIACSGEYLRGCSYEYLITCFTFCLLGYFNGRAKTTFSMLQGLSVAFLVRVPMSYVFTNTPGLTMYELGLVIPYSAIVNLIICVGYALILLYQDKKNGKFTNLENVPYYREKH